MMKILMKDMLRSVSSNKLRFLSVVLIIAIGISFFVGIKSASPEIRDKAVEYFSENNLLDVRVTSQIDFTDEDVAKIKELEGVENVVKSQFNDCIVMSENSYVTDINGAKLICRVSSADFLNAQQFTQTGKADDSYVNRLVLVSGRYPKENNECVVDASAAETYSSMKIGSVISVAGDSSTLSDSLKVTKYTIVGTVNSPMYISVDRGQTAIGNGSLNTFMFVRASAFANSNNVNELYIKIKNSDSYDKFSQKYENVVVDLANKIQMMSEDIIDTKLADLKADYSNRIDIKQAEIDDYTATSSIVLDEKKKEIDELKASVDNEDEILAAAKTKYEKEEKSAKDSLTSISSRFNTLDATYQADLKSYDAQSSEIKGYTELKTLYDELNSKHKKNANTLSTLSSTMKSAQGTLDEKKSAVTAKTKDLTDSQNKVSQLNSQIMTLQSEISSLQSKQTSLESEIESLKTEINSLQNSIAELEAKQTAGSITAMESISLNTYRSRLTSRNTDLRSKNTSLSSTKSSITIKNADLSKARTDLTAANTSVTTATASLASAKSELSLAQTAYNNAKSSYDDEKTSYDADTATLKKYMSSMQQLTAGQSNLASLQSSLTNEKTQLDALKISLTQAQIKYTLIVKNRNTDVQKAEYNLNVAKNRYSTVDSEYTDLKDEVDLKIKNLNGDLKNLKNLLRNADSISWDTTAQTELTGHKSFERSLENIRYMAYIFPLIFLMVAMLACFVIMTRNIEEDRNQIGIYKAMGYPTRTIFFKYFTYSFLAWIFGAAIGIAVGTCLLPRAVFSIYSMTYTVPKIGIVFNRWYINYSIIISAASTFVASIIAGMREAVHSPASLIRPRGIDYSRHSIFERIPILWGKLSYGMVLAARAISRGHKRVLVGVAGISCCTALILSSFGLANSATDITSSQYGKKGVMNYNVQLVLESPQEADDSGILSKVSSDKRTENAMLMSMTTVSGSNSATKSSRGNITVIVPQSTELMSQFFMLKSIDGSDNIADGVIITEGFADEVNLKVGDTAYFTDKNAIVHPAKVAGIVKNYINNYAYFSPEVFEETFLVAPEYKYIACGVKDYLTDTDIDNYVNDYLESEDVSGITTSDMLSSDVDDSINRVIAVVTMFIISACILAAIVMYTVTNINISERTREIANIKVIGFSNNEVVLYVSRENIISSAVGIVLGLIGGAFLHKIFVMFLSADTIMYGDRIFWWSYLATIAIVVFVAFITILPIKYKITKIQMAETLKSIE